MHTPSSLMVSDLRDVLSLLVDYSPFPLRFHIASQEGLRLPDDGFPAVLLRSIEPPKLRQQ
jgi:hypothetical protein